MCIFNSVGVNDGRLARTDQEAAGQQPLKLSALTIFLFNSTASQSLAIRRYTRRLRLPAASTDQYSQPSYAVVTTAIRLRFDARSTDCQRSLSAHWRNTGTNPLAAVKLTYLFI